MPNRDPESPILRLAEPADLDAIRALIPDAVRALSRGFYSEAQIESALRHVFGPDTQLVADRSYYVAIAPDGTLAACGGWSARHTLFGGDQAKGPTDAMLDPRRDAARIRAFYVAPAWARRGLGSALMRACVAAAGAAGFTRLELMATLPGEALYRRLGFTPVARHELTLPDGVRVPFVHMARALAADAAHHADEPPARAHLTGSAHGQTARGR